ncbi:hypothetical protein Tco_0435298 [Tanacetum coccineum]
MCDEVLIGLRALVGLVLEALLGLDLVLNKVIETISYTSESKPLALPWGRTPQLDSGVRVRKHVVKGGKYDDGLSSGLLCLLFVQLGHGPNVMVCQWKTSWRSLMDTCNSSKLHNDTSGAKRIEQMPSIHAISQQGNSMDCSMVNNAFSPWFLDLSGTLFYLNFENFIVLDFQWKCIVSFISNVCKFFFPEQSLVSTSALPKGAHVWRDLGNRVITKPTYASVARSNIIAEVPVHTQNIDVDKNVRRHHIVNCTTNSAAEHYQPDSLYDEGPSVCQASSSNSEHGHYTSQPFSYNTGKRKRPSEYNLPTLHRHRIVNTNALITDNKSSPLTGTISRLQSQTEPQTDSSHGTANGQFTFFTPAGDKVVGHPCSEMAAKYAEADP